MKNGLIIEEEAKNRNKLKNLLLQAYPEIITNECADYVGAYDAIKKTKYSIVLVDIGFQNGIGKDLIALIRKSSPDTYIIVCTTFDDDYHLLSALHAGAYGYLLKDISEDIFIRKLRGIINGDPPLSPGITRRLLRHYSSNDMQKSDKKNQHLSPRESEVLIYLAKGLSRKEIANLLNLTDSTIAGYIRDIYRSLDISCRAEAAIQACRMGLINPDKVH